MRLRANKRLTQGVERYMATIKLGTTGNANRLISYAEKKQLKRGLIATLNMLKVSLQLLESYMVKQMAYKLTMSFNLLSLEKLLPKKRMK